jgi:RimJ/RimL family protein N-acetyltransferase
MPTLQTDRLVLRMFRLKDFDAYAQMLADPEVQRYLGDGKPASRSEAWRHMAMLLGHWQLLGFGLWAVEERASGALIGHLCRRGEKPENRRPIIGPETPAQLMRQMPCRLARRNEALDLGSRIAG